MKCGVCFILGYQKIVEVLIQNGASINIQDKRAGLDSDQGNVWPSQCVKYDKDIALTKRTNKFFSIAK